MSQRNISLANKINNEVTTQDNILNGSSNLLQPSTQYGNQLILLKKDSQFSKQLITTPHQSTLLATSPSKIRSPQSTYNIKVAASSGGLSPRTQSSIRPNWLTGDIAAGINETQSYVSNTTAATRALSLQCKLKGVPQQMRNLADYEPGESVCFYQKGGTTDEINEEELFMPQTHFQLFPHESKLSWEKQNVDLFHKIKNIDTGQEFDVRKPKDLAEVESQTPSFCLDNSSQWEIWWEKKKNNEKELEKACKLNITEKIKEVIQGYEPDLVPNLNAGMEDNWTPLHFAAFYGNTAVCNLLILKDAAIDSRNDLQQTPLILSCIENRQSVASLLIELGADVNAQDVYLNTPLHYCFLNGDKDLLDIVLRKPYIQFNLRNSNDKLPFQETTDENLVEYFKSQVHKKEVQRATQKNQQRLRLIKEKEAQNEGVQRDSMSIEEEDGNRFLSSRESIFSGECNPDVYASNELSKYEVKGLLGQGSFGQVYLVVEKATNREFALKVLDKQKIVQNNMYKYAITERNILQIVDHPFVIKLFKAFQTSHSLFFLMENASQGDLLQHLQQEKRFSEAKARFYAAEALLALEYLHSLDILYRDLKASNILLSEDGHIRFSDFGLSKEGVKEYDRGARSFCGSVAYMPPEIIRNQGHGKAVDLYLLGIFIFEMLVGQPPFNGKDESQIYNSIQMSQLKFPSFLTRTAKSLLIKLLSKDPRFRPTPDHIKRHPFFSGIDWKQLELKNVKLPKMMIRKQQLNLVNPKDLLESGKIEISPEQLTQLKLGQELKNALFNKWTFISENK